MSLINEALKKAQRMRHQDSPGAPPAADPGTPTPSAPPAAMPLRRGRAPTSQIFLFAVVGIPLLIVVCVGVTWLLLRPSDEKSTVASDAPPPTLAAPSSAPPATPIDAPKAVPAPEPVAISLPLAPASPAANPAEPAPVAAPAPQPAPVAKIGVAEDPASPKPNPRVNAFLDTLRVSGIRASSTDPRVSMNDRVFRLNDIVDRNLELRIIGIAHEGLTFIDPSGFIYKIQF